MKKILPLLLLGMTVIGYAQSDSGRFHYSYRTSMFA